MYSFCATEYFSEDDKTVDNLYLQSEQDTKELYNSAKQAFNNRNTFIMLGFKTILMLAFVLISL